MRSVTLSALFAVSWLFGGSISQGGEQSIRSCQPKLEAAIDLEGGGADSVTFGDDSRFVAVQDGDRQASIWQLPRGARIRTLSQGGPIECCRFSPDGSLIASGGTGSGAGFPGMVKVYLAATGKEVATLRRHSRRVESIAFHPHGKLIATGSADGTIRVWSIEDAREIKCLKPEMGIVADVAFSPDGKWLAAGAQQVIRQWSTDTWQERPSIELKRLGGFCFTPDGAEIAICADPGIFVCSAATGKRLRTLYAHPEDSFMAEASRICISADSKTVAVGTGFKLVAREIASGNVLWQLDRSQLHYVNACALSRDGKRLVTGGAGAVRIWRLPPKSLGADGEDPAAQDLELLAAGAVKSDSGGLLEFLDQRTQFRSAKKDLKASIGKLGSEDFEERQRARAELTAAGVRALSALRAAQDQSDPELASAVRSLIKTIETTSAALSSAAARVLAVRRAPGAAETLLAYLPYVEDRVEEDDILSCLRTLAWSDAIKKDAITKALGDDLPIQRAAAVMLIGLLPGGERSEAVLRALKDRDPHVRFQAARVSLDAGEREAMPVLLALLEDGPLDLAWQAERLLAAIGDSKAPAIPLLATANSRRQCRAAWEAWWKDDASQPRFSWTPALDADRGTILTTDLDDGRVLALDSNFTVSWQIAGLVGPVDAQLLPSGRVLIAENHVQRVTERERCGRIVWEKKLAGFPVACRRLPNGNTFIATTDSLIEVGPDGRSVWTRKVAGKVQSARKLRDGRIAILPLENESLRPTVKLLSPEGNELGNITMQRTQVGDSSTLTVLPNGHYLIPGINLGMLVEFDRDGQAVGECKFPGAVAAARLPSGNTLVCDTKECRIVELDKTGKIVRQHKTEGRPWSVQVIR